MAKKESVVDQSINQSDVSESSTKDTIQTPSRYQRVIGILHYYKTNLSQSPSPIVDHLAT